MSRLQAKGCASFDDFTNMIHQLLKAAWGSDWGTFTEDYPNGRDAKNITLPMITYSLKSKVPGIVGNGSTREIKPRYRQTVPVPNAPEGAEEAMNIYSQVFDIQVQFGMWADNNAALNELCTKFEEFMMMYTGFFLEQGVQQIVFQELAVPWEQAGIDDTLASRNFKYLVRLEQQVAVPTRVIKEVIGKIGVIDGRISVITNPDDDPDQDKEAIEFRSK